MWLSHYPDILNKDGLPETSSTRKLILINGNIGPKRTALDVLSPDIYTPIVDVELLDHWNDEYEGVIINSESLPSSANAFASALQASLFQWKLKVWEKVKFPFLLYTTVFLRSLCLEPFFSFQITNRASWTCFCGHWCEIITDIFSSHFQSLQKLWHQILECELP